MALGNVVFSFRGEQQSGKTTAARYLEQRWKFVRVSFADPVREMVQKITPDGKIDKVRDRGLLQYFATEYYRDMIAEDYWVSKWEQKVQALLAEGRFVVVDDARFHNEINRINELGGKHVYIMRNGIRRRSPQTHRSEEQNDPYDPRHFTALGNFGSVNDFYDLLDGLVKGLVDAPSR